jgi:hypothetical protein
MSTRPLSHCLCLGISLCSLAVQAQEPDPNQENSAAAEAAQDLLKALPETTRADISDSFDSSERTNWNFVPMKRAGVPLGALSSEQRGLLDPLLASALSPQALATAKDIIEHESILAALERDRGVSNWQRRDPSLFYTLIFGTPSSKENWAWRFEGHHLAVNVTHVAGHAQVVAPMFMGANPARVPSGPKAGLRLLAAEEDLARALIHMLPADRKARAIISERALNEIVTGNDPKVQSLAMEGLTAAQMSVEERTQLRKLLNIYIDRMTHSAAREQLERIESAGFEKIHFAWAGSIEPNEPHYYRIHGPTFLIEFDNTQNNANHIHTVWRDLQRDFGGDLLREHYRSHHH